jgi:hypothetical protein
LAPTKTPEPTSTTEPTVLIPPSGIFYFLLKEFAIPCFSIGSKYQLPINGRLDELMMPALNRAKMLNDFRSKNKPKPC